MFIGTGVSSGGGKRRGGNPRRYKGLRRSGKRIPLKVSPAFARGVLRVTKPESKFFYTNAVNLTVQFTFPMTTPLDDIKQGSGASDRIGNTIHPTVLYGHVTVQGSHDGDAGHAGVRICIVQYHEDASVVAFNPQILLQLEATPGGPWAVINKGKFSIVWDKYVTLSMRRDNSQFLKTCAFNVNVKNRPDPLYDEAVRKKHTYYMVVLTDAAGGPDHIEASVQIQLRYTDS